MNASDWQAVAEVGGFVLTIFGFGSGLVYALLRTRFVTRVEHDSSHFKLDERLTCVEGELEEKVGKDDLNKLNDRLFGCEQGLSTTTASLAKTNGLLEGVSEAAKVLTRQLNMVIENDLRNGR